MSPTCPCFQVWQENYETKKFRNTNFLNTLEREGERILCIKNIKTVKNNMVTYKINSAALSIFLSAVSAIFC